MASSTWATSLGNLQDGQHLSLVNVVADVDVDVLDVARHLGVQLDVLVRAELAGDGKRIGDGLALDRSDGGVRNSRGVSPHFVRTTADGEPARARFTTMPATNTHNTTTPNTSNLCRR